MTQDTLDDRAEVHYLTCPLCEATCGLEVHVKHGQVQTIRGDKADPLSQGYMCPKGFGLKGIHEDPDRIRVPLIRRDDKWEEVSWETAFEYIRERVNGVRAAYGTDAVGVYLGNPNVHNLDAQLYLSSVIRAANTRNRFSASTMDQFPKQLVAAYLYGHPMRIPVPDVDRTMYFLILGANPLVSNGSMMTAPNMRDRLRKLQQRGGKVVVIDPVRTRTAEVADAHHFIRPGTDAWFLLGMLHTLHADGLFRLGKLEDHVQGLATVADLATRVTPDVAAEHCGIPAEVIQTIAREFAAAEGGVVYGRMGTCTQQFGGLTTWLIDVLNIVTGNLDQPGGAMFPLAAAAAQNAGGARRRGKEMRIGRFRSRVRGLPEVLGELPVAVMAEEMDVPGDGQIKALITIAGNPALSAPDSRRLQKALSQLEFVVSVDFYLNETTQYANVFLPVPSPLERDHYDLTFSQLSIRNIAHFSKNLFPLAPEQRPEWEVLLHLCAALNNQSFDTFHPAELDEAIIQSVIASAIQSEDAQQKQQQVQSVLQRLHPEPGPRRFLDLMIRSGPYGDGFGLNPSGLTLEKVMESIHGVDLGPLVELIPGVITTPSGKIELAPELFVQHVERLLSHATSDTSEFVLVGRRILHSNNTWMHNVDVIYKAIADPSLWMNEADAARLDIADGDMVQVASRSGNILVHVQTRSDVMPGVLSLPHGFGHDARHARLRVASDKPGVNYNVLSDTTRVDETSGNAVLNGIPVTISKHTEGLSWLSTH